MRFSGKIVFATLTAACLAFAAAPASARIGVVMMHGNANWGGQFEPMVPIMKEAGYGFEAPDMCWADVRKYDHTAEECMADVDKAIAKLKAAGYDQIVVGGHSMGGINTLLYAANQKGLAGIIVFAPSSKPSRDNSDPMVAFARKLVAAGQGDKRVDFPTSGINSLYVAPKNFLSFFGPESPLYDSELLPKISAPILWVAGTDDPGQRDAAERYKLAPPAPLNRFIVVKADHFGTPDVATPDMVAWLNELQATLDKSPTKPTN
jgi:pimeloyl-ACP methyl ester carboxylesterase